MSGATIPAGEGVLLTATFDSPGSDICFTDAVMSGVVVLSTGAWFDPDDEISLDRHGNPNVLTKDVGTSSLAQGPTSHTTLVEVKKAKKEIIKDVQIFNSPKINC